MTSREDLEGLLYKAITGGRLSGRTHTVDNAIRELGRRIKEPWKAAGVSRETWRRWNLPPGAKNAQKPSPAKQAGLLAALRRLRFSTPREAKIGTPRGSTSPAPTTTRTKSGTSGRPRSAGPGRKPARRSETSSTRTCCGESARLSTSGWSTCPRTPDGPKGGCTRTPTALPRPSTPTASTSHGTLPGPDAAGHGGADITGWVGRSTQRSAAVRRLSAQFEATGKGPLPPGKGALTRTAFSLRGAPSTPPRHRPRADRPSTPAA